MLEQNNIQLNLADELSKTQKIFKACLESSNHSIILAIDKEFKYLFFNNSHQTTMKNVYGSNIEIGMNILDSITIEADRDNAKKNYNRALSGESHSTIEIYGDNEQSYFESHFNPIFDDNGEIFGATVFAHDITEQKRVEEALRKSEVQYKSLFHNLNSSFSLYKVIFNENNEPYDYRILAVNPMYEKTVGVEASSVVGKTLLEAFPQTEPIWLETLKKLILTGEPISVESYAVEVDKWIEIKVYVPEDGFMAMIATDVTERKQAEVTLKESKEFQDRIINNIGDPIFVKDNQHRMTLVNDAFCSMLDLERSDIIGRTLAENLPPEEMEHFLKIDKQVLSDGQENLCEEQLTVKDGQTLTILTKKNRYIDEDGNKFLIGVIRDITERKEAEKEHEKLNHQINQMQKLESLGLLAGGIAHDFNNLLSGMFGYVDIAIDNIDNNEPKEAKRSLLKAFNVFDRTKALTQQLLTFAKGGAPIRKLINLTQVIENCTKFSLSGSKVTAKLDIAEDLWLCNCDKNQIGQAIDNIVINAQQAMPIGGEILVSAKNEIVNKKQTGNINGSGNFVKISIKDKGIGISKELLPKIFDPFFTTKNLGHGLGLATVFSIIKRHGGWIDVESEAGKGTTLHLFLPASPDNNTETPITKTSYHKGSGTILVMDDEEFIRDIAGVLLENMGYEVVFAKDGQEAILLFKNAHMSGNGFKITILDLTIPNGIGGIETVKTIREVDEKAVVIVASGYADDPAMINPKKYGFTAKIAKPFRKSELSQLVDSLVKNS